MGKVNTDILKPGMVLAEDLFHSDGRLLLSKGVRLNPNHLRVLKIWGIVAAEIEGVGDVLRPPTLNEDEIGPDILQEAEKSTQKRFSQAQLDHPFIRELFRICTLRLAQQMVLKKTPGSNGGHARQETAPKANIKPSPTARSSEKILGSLLDEDVSLASLPHIFIEISRVLNDPRSSAIHVADVIGKDPNLAARLLRVVNSAFYGFPAKISTISRAVVILGSRQLSALALGTSVVKIFKDIPADLVDMKSFWEHSIACGIAARMIASYKNMANTERLFVAGLLHDVGRIVIYKYLPDQGREMLLHAQQNDCLLRSAELEVLGFDHAQIGAMLMQKWKLPLILEQALEFHHQPAPSQSFLEASIVHIADILINALRIGTSGERFVPPLIPEVWTELGLPTEIFTESIRFIDRQIEEVIHDFF
jgi:putative nucleotidyltransferase with HDIG domain